MYLTDRVLGVIGTLRYYVMEEAWFIASQAWADSECRSLLPDAAYFDQKVCLNLPCVDKYPNMSFSPRCEGIMLLKDDHMKTSFIHNRISGTLYFSTNPVHGKVIHIPTSDTAGGSIHRRYNRRGTEYESLDRKGGGK